MSISSNIAKDLSGIQHLTEKDVYQIHSLMIDFFAAAFAGYSLNRDFNTACERVIYPVGGGRRELRIFAE